jgi:hypothetical protein
MASLNFFEPKLLDKDYQNLRKKLNDPDKVLLDCLYEQNEDEYNNKIHLIKFDKNINSKVLLLKLPKRNI